MSRVNRNSGSAQRDTPPRSSNTPSVSSSVERSTRSQRSEDSSTLSNLVPRSRRSGSRLSNQSGVTASSRASTNTATRHGSETASVLSDRSDATAGSSTSNYSTVSRGTTSGATQSLGLGAHRNELSRTSQPPRLSLSMRSTGGRYEPSDLPRNLPDTDAYRSAQDLISVAEHLSQHSAVARNPRRYMSSETASRYSELTRRFSELSSDVDAMTRYGTDVNMGGPSDERDTLAQRIGSLSMDHGALRDAIQDAAETEATSAIAPPSFYQRPGVGR